MVRYFQILHLSHKKKCCGKVVKNLLCGHVACQLEEMVMVELHTEDKMQASTLNSAFWHKHVTVRKTFVRVRRCACVAFEKWCDHMSSVTLVSGDVKAELFQ